jgi:nucleoside-diphosphate-sugar epimerase
MELRGKRIAVTGATGFLGRYIVDALLARGTHVIGVVRNPARVPALAEKGVELRQADLAEPDRLASGFAGADAVVSNAALFSLTNSSWKDHERCNVEGTANVMRACRDAGVRRVVHVSSVAVYGIFARGRLHEDTPQLGQDTRRLPWNVYATSKALSEQAAWRLAKESGLDLTTVRPCTIYGAFDPNFMPIFKRVTGLPISIRPAGMRQSYVYAGDVAEGIALALERDASIGRAYNLTGDGETWQDLTDAWRAAGGTVPRLAIPVPLPLAPDFDSSRARQELGWRPRSLLDGVRETLALEARSAR